MTTTVIMKKPLPPPVPVWRKWNTLQTLWASLYLIWAMDALLMLASIIGAQVHRDAMKGVGKDTGPSIIHAQHIKTALADMDANVANELLGAPGKMPEAVKAYEVKRKEAATALIEAAKNITFDEDEQKPIEAIQVFMGTYEAQVQRARDLHEEGDASFVSAYRNAAKVMDEQILPQADELDRVNHEELEKAYNGLSNRSVGSVFLLLVAGAALLGALFGVQKFLNEKTHRILNPLLLAATLFTLWFIFYTFVTLGSERHRLKVAKEDAFTSIHALWRGRAVAYAANADESRYLLDAPRASEYERAFNDKADKLAKRAEGVSIANSEISGTGIKGYLGDELNNITFEGEREAALATLTAFNKYVRVDDELRRLQKSGKHAEALELVIGSRTDESNGVFKQFDQALDKTIGINQDAFDQAVERGFATLSYFELKAAMVALLIAVLAFFGLYQRIREYQ